MKKTLILEKNNFFKLLNSKLGDVRPLLNEGLTAIFAAALKNQGGRKVIKNFANTVFKSAEDLKNIDITPETNSFSTKILNKYNFTISFSLKIKNFEIKELKESTCTIKISVSCYIKYSSPDLSGNLQTDIVNVGSSFLDQMGKIKIESNSLNEATKGINGGQNVNAWVLCECNYNVEAIDGKQRLTLAPTSYKLQTSPLTTPYGGSISIWDNVIYLNTEGLAGLKKNIISFGKITEFKGLTPKIQAKSIDIDDKDLSSYTQQ
jgi:hypothetical protein